MSATSAPAAQRACSGALAEFDRATCVRIGLLGSPAACMALIALSFVLIYKGTGVVNFAVGEVMMLGAYLYYAGARDASGCRRGWPSCCRWSASALLAIVDRARGAAPAVRPAGDRGADGDDRHGQHPPRRRRGGLGRRHLSRCRQLLPRTPLPDRRRPDPGHGRCGNFAVAAVADRRRSLAFFRFSRDRRRAARDGERPGHRRDARHRTSTTRSA